MSIDTQDWTCDRATMSSRIKRTYNLAPETVQRVRELTESYGVASSQDAVIELAVDELDRRLRETRESEIWAALADDPQARGEAADLEAAYATADAETWPR